MEINVNIPIPGKPEDVHIPSVEKAPAGLPSAKVEPAKVADVVKKIENKKQDAVKLPPVKKIGKGRGSASGPRNETREDREPTLREQMSMMAANMSSMINLIK